MPIVIRTAWLPDNLLGECVRRQHQFVVRLNNQIGEDQAIEILCHEWAHALAWNYSLDQLAHDPDLDPAEFDQASHDEAWGCAYARVWRGVPAAARSATTRARTASRAASGIAMPATRASHVEPDAEGY